MGIGDWGDWGLGIGENPNELIYLNEIKLLKIINNKQNQ